MAKIYQTKIDLEREELSKQPARERESARSLFYTGILSTLFVPISHELETLRAFKAERLGSVRGKFESGLGKAAPYFAGALAVFSFVSAYWIRNKAKETEQKIRKLGAEEIVLPPDVEVKMGIPMDNKFSLRIKKEAEEKDCGCHHRH